MPMDEALWWLPTAAALLMTALALLAALAQPARPAKSAWLALILLCGVGAVGLSAWQQAGNRAALGEETARLQLLWERLSELGRSIPGGAVASPGETFDTIPAAIRSLNARIAELEEQIRALHEKARRRVIDREGAAEMARYLRRFGSHRVVVSCVPDDVEAFAYASQLAAVLREAGWEAVGPEQTAIHGEAPSMAVRLLVRHPGAPPEAVRALVDAFNRFSIPYRSGLGASDAIPDPATVELFVSRKS